MSVIKHNTKEIDLLGRLMRAEAVGDGNEGMIMVGNVVVNRFIALCYTFEPINTITKAVYQNPGGFEAIHSPPFNNRTTTHEKNLVERVLKGEWLEPATHALWFYAPKPGESCRAQWFGQWNTGRYRGHCFYAPQPEVCPEVYTH